VLVSARSVSLWLIPVLIAIKVTFLWADPVVRLYLGDSAAYLWGAMDDGRLPDDRSFTYSWLIRLVVAPADGLVTLLRWQAVAGIGTALFLFVALRRYLRVPPALAACAAVLLAIEPAQLFYERMVLAEAPGLLLFVAFYVAAAAYLASGRGWWLPIVALLGLLAASLRLNYLPVVIVISLALPLVRLMSAAPPARRWLLQHTAVALCAVTLLHVGYRSWVAMIFHSPPGYLARAGFMQLGLVTPLIRPEHFERAGLPRTFEEELDYPLSDPEARMEHMWAPGGLVAELRRRQLDVESIARALSGMALRDDPLGLIRLGVGTVGNYFVADRIEHALDNDLGRRPIPYDVLWTLRERWNYDATGLSTRVTVVSRYFEASTWWLVACLFLLPVLSVWSAAAHWRTPQRAQALLAALFGVGLFLAHVLFVNVAFYRYLHPLPFFVLLNGLAGWAALRPEGRASHGGPR
jgi:hypothetical protein